MVKFLLSVLACLSITMTLSSCMDDPITTDEAIPQNITRPSSVGFTFLDYTPGAPTGDIRVHWTNSSSDRQQNFEGYVVRLMTRDSALFPGGVMAIKTTPIAEQIVGKTVFEAVFTNVPVNEDYVVGVWGKRFSTLDKPDSLVLSRDSMARDFIFDPRPLDNPTMVRAASTGRNSLKLEWDKPSTHSQRNLLSYAVYYRDPSRLADSAKLVQSPAFDTGRSEVTFTVPLGQGSTPIVEYEFWVKAIRTDSAQSYTDSTLIRWSGAERFKIDSLQGVKLGRAIFLGLVAPGVYGVRELDPNDANARIKLDQSGDEVILTGLQGTKFFATYHEAQGLDIAKFSAPLTSADYDRESINLPSQAPQGGWIVYAKLFGQKGEPLRMWLRTMDSTSIVSRNNTVSGEVMYQPSQVDKVPPLPYF